MWIDYRNEINDIGHMYIPRTFDITTGSSQYVIEKPIHLPNIDDNYKGIYLSLKNFDPLSYDKNAPLHIKECITSIKRKGMKERSILDSGIVKPIVI